MNLPELKNKVICDELDIPEDFGRVFSFVDFSNVNRWFEKDNQDWNNKLLNINEKLDIDIKKLKLFTDIFSKKARIYYGEDFRNPESQKFIYLIRKIFGNKQVTTKDLQRIKHYIVDEEIEAKPIRKDKNGNYIEIRKCNFDVEISVDAVKMMDHYDTFCIFSGDADFTYLNNFLKNKGKNIIIVKGGFITSKLRKSSDLIINAQRIKKYITRIKENKNLNKSGLCG